MKVLTVAFGLAAALTIMADPPPIAAAEIGNGPAEVTLAACAQGSSQADTHVPGCSYSYLTKVAAPSYTYVTSQGAVSWKDGTVTSGALDFPAAGQTWPALTDLFLGASSTATPKSITGTVDADGRVDLTMQYDVLLKAGANECRLTGTTQLSSAGTEKLGGQATGKDYDPATGQFAVVSTTYPAPTTAGSCLLTSAAYDLSKGMGWYLTGTMKLPGGTPVTPASRPPRSKLPKKVKRKGKTVLLKKAVVTNAGQKATAKVTWSTKKSAKGSSKKYANLETNKSGKITITTTGKAKKLSVKLSLKASAVPGYQAYSSTKKWTVK